MCVNIKIDAKSLKGDVHTVGRMLESSLLFFISRL